MKVYQIILMGLLVVGCSYEPRRDYHRRALKMAFSRGQSVSTVPPWANANGTTNTVEVDVRPAQFDSNGTQPVREKVNP